MPYLDVWEAFTGPVWKKTSHRLGLFYHQLIRRFCHLSLQNFTACSYALFLNCKCACKGFLLLSGPECAQHLRQVLMFGLLFSCVILRNLPGWVPLVAFCTQCYPWLQNFLQHKYNFVDQNSNIFKKEIFFLKCCGVAFFTWSSGRPDLLTAGRLDICEV